MVDDSQGLVEGMKGLSNNFNFKKEKDNTNRETESSSTRQTLHTCHQSLMTITEKVNEAWVAGYKTKNSILKYADSKNRCLAGSEAKKH